MVADEGGGPRDLPPVKGHPGLARHIATALTADEFDLSYFQAKPLDHGCFSPLSVMWSHEGGWPGAVVPLQVGVLEFPIPTARRCFRLGRSLRRAIESYPEDLKVAIVATGGLALLAGAAAAWNEEIQRGVLLVLLAVVIPLPIVVRVLQKRWDPFEPIFAISVGLFVLVLVQLAVGV